jgi:hypothetical protein
MPDAHARRTDQPPALHGGRSRPLSRARPSGRSQLSRGTVRRRRCVRARGWPSTSRRRDRRRTQRRRWRAAARCSRCRTSSAGSPTVDSCCRSALDAASRNRSRSTSTREISSHTVSRSTPTKDDRGYTPSGSSERRTVEIATDNRFATTACPDDARHHDTPGDRDRRWIVARSGTRPHPDRLAQPADHSTVTTTGPIVAVAASRGAGDPTGYSGASGGRRTVRRTLPSRLFRAPAGKSVDNG